MKVITYGTRINENGNSILIKESCGDYAHADRLDNPGKVARFMDEYLDLGNRAEEFLYLCALDNKNSLIGLFEVFHGTVNQSCVSNREIFLRALLCGAAKIIISHNHPSGDTTPSGDDIQATREIEKAGRLMRIPLIDHIIIGRNGQFTSLREMDILE